MKINVFENHALKSISSIFTQIPKTIFPQYGHYGFSGKLSVLTHTQIPF